MRLEWSRREPALSFQESYNFFTRVSECPRASLPSPLPHLLPGAHCADSTCALAIQSPVPWSANCGCLATTWHTLARRGRPSAGEPAEVVDDLQQEASGSVSGGDPGFRVEALEPDVVLTVSPGAPCPAESHFVPLEAL